MSDDFLQDQPTGNNVSGHDPVRSDPIRQAQRAMRTNMPKRFYKDVTVEQRDEGHVVLLDGRIVKTPGKLTLALRDARLAEAVADEWRAQETHILPDTMHLTRIANSGIEAVPPKREDVADEIAGYARSDLLCYRVETPERLAERHTQHWDPVLGWIEETFGARFTLAGGIVHVTQSDEALLAIRKAVGAFEPMQLAALHTATSLSGSVLLALALAHGHLDTDTAWAAACVDEHWNVELWGEDTEATRARARKREEFSAASFVLASL